MFRGTSAKTSAELVIYHGGMVAPLGDLVGSCGTPCTPRVHHRGRLTRCSWMLPTGRIGLYMRFPHVQLHAATPFGGLWLRGSRVRAPSVTLSYCCPNRRVAV